MKTHRVYLEDTLTHAQREIVYTEGEQAFKQGERRASNPYAASSPTLAQVWLNGWDHGRRIGKLALTVRW